MKTALASMHSFNSSLIFSLSAHSVFFIYKLSPQGPELSVPPAAALLVFSYLNSMHALLPSSCFVPREDALHFKEKDTTFLHRDEIIKNHTLHQNTNSDNGSGYALDHVAISFVM